MNKLQFITMLKLGKSPKKSYEKEVSKAYIEQNIKANQNGFDAVIKALKAGNKSYAVDEFQKAYDKTPLSSDLKATLKENTRAFYIYNKRVKRIKFAKADPNFTLNIKDIKAIRILGNSDLLWIKNHATRTNVSTVINRIITDGLNNYLSGDAIAESLTGMIDKLGANGYIDLFGEKRYWEMVTNTNMTRVSSFGDINTFDEAGITAYRIDTRGALACDICSPYNNKVYEVRQASSKMNLYLNYADNGDVESMKEIYTFGEANVEGIGETPPFHPNCYCEMIAIIE